MSVKSKWKKQSAPESSSGPDGASESLFASLIGRFVYTGIRSAPVIWLISLLALSACLISRKNEIINRINRRELLVIGLDEIVKASRIAALRGCVRTSEYQAVLKEYGIKSWPMVAAPGEAAVRSRGHLLLVQIGAVPKSRLRITMGEDGEWITEVDAVYSGERLAVRAMLFPFWGGK